MTNTIIDPQEQALMQAVVEKALELFDADERLLVATNYEDGTAASSAAERARIGLDKATASIRDYRAKSSSLEPARCEPPEGTKGNTFHWLIDEERIEPFCWTSSGRWLGVGRSRNWTPGTVADDGWRYHSVASPCLPDTSPSDTEVEAEIGHTHGRNRRTVEAEIGNVRRCVPSPIEEVAEQVHPADTRIQPTDEAINAFLDANNWWQDDDTFHKIVRATLAHFSPTRPIDMILFCPACGLQHVDEPDERTVGWENPPHRSHLCHGCGHIWRPADVPTNGVKAIKTVGKADSPIVSPTQTSTPVEPEITDEEILKLGHKLFCYVGDDSNNCADIIEFARALLARHASTSISNSTLDKIQSIAKTREPEQFRNECRDMLRGGG
jgi:hypothetical protein